MEASCIFFDLETSDKNFVGQIMNYAFLVTDENFGIVDELCGEIRLSCLQLPSPAAILANRIDVCSHQARARDSEREASLKIYHFLERLVSSAAKPLPLVGYNSSRFDVPFLRTTLIRNGLNPYFRSRLIYRDLLHLVRKLSISEPRFPRFLQPGSAGPLSLSLESVTTQLQLLQGCQRHESRADVELTIALAKYLASRLGADISTFDAYEPERFVAMPATPPLVYQLKPNYDQPGRGRYLERPMALLDCGRRSALWIDLDRYQAGEGRQAISWIGYQNGQFVAGSSCPDSYTSVAAAAQAEFHGLTVDTFFPLSSCDIEQDIYRLDIQQVAALERALWHGAELQDRDADSKDLRVLLTRAKLRAAAEQRSALSLSGSASDGFSQRLRQYGLYRYGGRLQLYKTLPAVEDPLAFHPTITQYLAEIRQNQTGGSSEQVTLLDSLLRYYETADVFRLVADVLIPDRSPRKPEPAAPSAP